MRTNYFLMIAIGLVALLSLGILFRDNLRTTVETSPHAVSINIAPKPFTLEDVEINFGQTIAFKARTSAPKDALYQVSVYRKLISKENVGASMLPHVGIVNYDPQVELSSRADGEQLAESFGKIIDGSLNFQVEPYHPFIQAFGTTLDSNTYSFSSFDQVLFELKILNCPACKQEYSEDLSGADWVSFEETRSFPVKIYDTLPSQTELEEICQTIGRSLSGTSCI